MGRYFGWYRARFIALTIRSVRNVVPLIKQWKKLFRRLEWELKKPSFPKNANGKTLLHIGCGEINSPEFINIDARKYPHVHFTTDDITDLSMVPNEAVDLVYMCHILEHVKRSDLETALGEMKRILKKGGTLRISVPDFDHILHIYEARGHDIGAIAPPLMGGQDYQYNFHYSVFNHAYLAQLLRTAGFGEVHEWDPLACEFHQFEDWASRWPDYGDATYPISLNLEAVK